MIGVATDLRAPDALDRARLLVSRGDTSVVVVEADWELTGTSEPFNLPGSFGVFSDGEEFLIDVDLQGFKNGGQLLSRRARFSLIEDQTLFVRLTLVGGCQDRTDCAASQTCVEGTCQEPDLDSRTFPPFSEELVEKVSCLGGMPLIQTQTGDPMPSTNDAAMCPANLCSEGFCHVDPTAGSDPGRPDGGVDVPVLPPHTYVVGKQTIPQNNNQARQLGLDLNGDGTVDNQLGMVTSAFSGQGLDPQQLADTAVDRGESLTLINVGLESFTNGNTATFATFIGNNPQPAACANVSDMICRKHLAGDAMFDVSPSSPTDSIVVGPVVGGSFTSNPGRLTINATFTAPLVFDLIGARARITSFDETSVTGIIAGGVTQTDLDQKIIPALASQYGAIVSGDCGTTPPSCGCLPGSTGQTLIALFDTSPNDCSISVNEVKNNSFLQSLFSPDLTIDGQAVISFGIGFTAVAAKFQVPAF